MQAHHCSSEGAVSSLEEAIGDKEKQISQLREQRDRAEQEKHEERDLHEREIAEYKMKLHTLESEVEKLGVRLDRALAEKDKLEAKLESSQSELGKSKAELDRVQGDAGKSSVEWESAKQRISRYEMENERLKSENERLRHDLDRSTSTFGRTQLNVTQEAERIQEKLDKTQVFNIIPSGGRRVEGGIVCYCSEKPISLMGCTFILCTGGIEASAGRIADEPVGVGEEPCGGGAIAGESREIPGRNLPPQSQIGERPVGKRKPPGQCLRPCVYISKSYTHV